MLQNETKCGVEFPSAVARENQRKRKRFRSGHPPKKILAAIRFLWAVTVGAEGFSSADRTNSVAFAWF
jgi:hypothetical protein